MTAFDRNVFVKMLLSVSQKDDAALLPKSERSPYIQKLLEAFDITQPTLSHHMKILCECGLVETRKEGKWSHYSLNCETLSAFKAFVEALNCCKGGDCECR